MELKNIFKRKTKEEFFAEYGMTRSEYRKQRREKKNNLPVYTLDNDIRYCGKLRIIHLRIIAWACIIVGQISMVLAFYNKLSGKAAVPPAISTIIMLISSLTLPCFLLASFAYIIQHKDRFKSVLIANGLMAIVLALLFFIFYFHFGLGLTIKATKKSPAEALVELNKFLIDSLGGKLSFNIFIDLFMCALFVFFLLGKPAKWCKTKNQILSFRLFALIPVVYELSTIIVYALAAYDVLEISPIALAFFPTKPPLTFLAFIIITFIEKNKTKKYYKLGGTEEGYTEFIKTNKNSFMFSKSTALTFLVIGVLDVLLIVICEILAANTGSQIVKLAISLKLGDSADLLLLSPFILLFSYNKIHVPSKKDLIIPIVGLVIIALMYIEGFYQIIISI